MINSLPVIVIQIMIIARSYACKWPQVDALFIMDSTVNVGERNHQLIKEFVLATADHMQIGLQDTRVALVEYTPKASDLLNLFSGISSSRVRSAIEEAKYSPCFNENSQTCQPHASINSIARNELKENSGDRKDVPDVVIVISSATFRIPETRGYEVLLEPISPIHVFYVIVGALDDYATNGVNYAAAATTIKFSAINYTVLPELVEPLCLSSNDFISRDRVEEPTANAASISIIVALVLVFIVLLALLLYAVYSYRRENAELRRTLADVEERYRHVLVFKKETESTVSPQDGSVSGSVRHTQQQQLSDERALLKHYDRRLDEVIPIYQGNSAVTSDRRHLLPEDARNGVNLNGSNAQGIVSEGAEQAATVKDNNESNVAHGVVAERQNPGENSIAVQNAPPLSSMAANETDKQQQQQQQEEEEEEKEKEEEQQEQEPQLREQGNRSKAETKTTSSSEGNESDSDMEPKPDSDMEPKPAKDPSKALPPIDLLLLIDGSSSVGNVIFEQMKKYVIALLNNVDIMPGRSRVAAIEFASEPTVYFDFNKFYSHRAVNAAIRRMPYLGGPTFLAKALAFASGILYKEQNMKDGRHRRHNLMPTPRHDRPQIMIVVTDSYAEDNIDKAANILHDKMHVKIAALVWRIYNREKLLPLTRYDGAIFTRDQTEALSIWIWRQQRTWYENYGSYIEKEKASPLDNR